jgi:prevent-host-death family protein
MEVNVHHAKTNLSKLIAAAENGEEVIIARAGKPAVKLVVVPIEPKKKDRVAGRLKDKLKLPENWEEKWEEYGRELEDIMTNGPVFPEETVPEESVPQDAVKAGK